VLLTNGAKLDGVTADDARDSLNGNGRRVDGNGRRVVAFNNTTTNSFFNICRRQHLPTPHP